VNVRDENAADEPPVTEGRAKKLLFFLGLVALVPLALTAIGLLGYQWFLLPTSDDGTCLVFDRQYCSDISVSRIEREARVKIPQGSTIAESGASRNLKAGSQFALIRLPPSASLTLGSGYAETPTADAPGYATDYLADVGIDGLDAVAVDERLGSWVYFWHSDDEQSWAYVHVAWNG
jgi:hypothetical protein